MNAPAAPAQPRRSIQSRLVQARNQWLATQVLLPGAAIAVVWPAAMLAQRGDGFAVAFAAGEPLLYAAFVLGALATQLESFTHQFPALRDDTAFHWRLVIARQTTPLLFIGYGMMRMAAYFPFDAAAAEAWATFNVTTALVAVAFGVGLYWRSVRLIVRHGG